MIEQDFKRLIMDLNKQGIINIRSLDSVMDGLFKIERDIMNRRLTQDYHIANRVNPHRTRADQLIPNNGKHNFDSDTFVINTENNRVGIGTNSPVSTLEIYSGLNLLPQVSATNNFNGTTAGYYMLKKARSGGAVQNGDTLGTILWQGMDTGPTQYRNAATLTSLVNGTPTATYVPAKIRFALVNNSGTNQVVSEFFEGQILGSPTGGDKGLGTLNVAGNIYKNNTAYTNPDYALEYWATGDIRVNAHKPGAKEYKQLSIYEIEDHILKYWRLPGIDDEPAGIFDMADKSLELIERLYTITIEQQKQIDSLQERVSVLEDSVNKDGE